MGFSQAEGFIAAVVVSFFGAIVVRVILEAVSPKRLTGRRVRNGRGLPSRHDRNADARRRDDGAARPDQRPYSPGLEGVIAGETALSKVDGERGRLTYRGYRIGDLVEHGSYPAVANLLWTGDWDAGHRLPTGPSPAPVLADPPGAAELRRSRWTRCGPPSRRGARRRTCRGRRRSTRPGR